MMDLRSGLQRKEVIKSFFGVLTLTLTLALFPILPSMAAEHVQEGGEKLEGIKEITDFRKERDKFFKNHPRSPLKEGEKGKFNHLDYFPIDARFRFRGIIERYTIDIRDPQYYATFLTNKGTKKRYIRYGQFRFSLNGKGHALKLYKSILSDALFIPFKDRTNGKETYPGGRYLDAEIVVPDYEVTIDFNMAYNPSCAYNENFICALPPEENTLSVEIQAGEKKFR